jgi:hypothetical protein
VETPRLEALATAEQRARFKADAWAEPIREWIGRRKDVSVAEVIEGALAIAREDWTQTVQNRVARILTAAGFTKHRANRRGKRENRYQKV